jgi:regulator of nucleoside diphosphate kinase
MISHLDLPPIVIPADDRNRLQAVARSLAEQSHPLAVPLLQELGRAELRDPEAVSEDTVALDRFVTYRTVGSDQSTRALLIHPEDRMWPLAEITVATPLGITLLGLSTGDCMPMIGSRLSEPPWVEIVAVGPSATGGIARRPSFAGRQSFRSLADLP